MQRVLQFCVARKFDSLAGGVPPDLATASFDALDDAIHAVLTAVCRGPVPVAFFWSTEEGGLGFPRPYRERRAALY